MRTRIKSGDPLSRVYKNGIIEPKLDDGQYESPLSCMNIDKHDVQTVWLGLQWLRVQYTAQNVSRQHTDHLDVICHPMATQAWKEIKQRGDTLKLELL